MIDHKHFMTAHKGIVSAHNVFSIYEHSQKLYYLTVWQCFQV